MSGQKPTASDVRNKGINLYNSVVELTAVKDQLNYFLSKIQPQISTPSIGIA